MIIKDLTESGSVRQNSSGFGADRIFLVQDVAGKAEAKLYNAITTAGIPQYRDPHPIIPEIVVTDISASPVTKEPTTVKIRVSYGIPKAEDTLLTDADAGEVSAASIKFDTSLSSEETHFDINGEFMTAEFRGAQFFTKFVAANVKRPQQNVTFERTEATLPKSAITDFLGSVNSTPWNGFPAKTWLCTGIDANEDKGQFKVVYTFTHNVETWRYEIIIGLTNEQIEELPPDVETANGYAIYDVYPLADFNILGLNF